MVVVCAVAGSICANAAGAQIQSVAGFPDGTVLGDITAGPGKDVSVTFGQLSEQGVGVISPQGSLTKLALSVDYSDSIAAGSDGNLWIGEPGSIARVTPAGQLTSFSLPHGADGGSIVSAADGNLWFVSHVASGNILGRITTQGVVSEFPIVLDKSLEPFSWGSLTTGPGGSLWATVAAPSTGAVVKLSLTGRVQGVIRVGRYVASTTRSTRSITAGPDGNIWLIDGSGVDRIAPSTGRYRRFAIAGAGLAGGITTGPDGNLWFTYSLLGDKYTSYSGSELGRVTPTGRITLFDQGTEAVAAGAIEIVSSAGRLWYTLMNDPGYGGGVQSFAPPTGSCLVPRLRGRSVSQAHRLLRRADCQLGALARPRHPHCPRRRLVVLDQDPGSASKQLALTSVALRLACPVRRVAGLR